MYWRKAALYHLPRVWIVESSIPAAAAVVATPILKLWPAYWCWGRPMEYQDLASPFHKSLLGDDCLGGVYEAVWLPLRLMYCIRADTRQSEFPVRPNTTSDPMPYWSHFDTLRCTWTILGTVWLSTAISLHARLFAGWKADCNAGSSSPSRKKPKNAVVAIAQMAVLSGSDELVSEEWIFSRIYAVMGKSDARGGGSFQHPDSADSSLHPLQDG